MATFTCNCEALEWVHHQSKGYSITTQEQRELQCFVTWEALFCSFIYLFICIAGRLKFHSFTSMEMFGNGRTDPE
jgi:hypothetical protein